jgi:hypothetical protein
MAGTIAAGMHSTAVADGAIVAATVGVTYTLADAMDMLADATPMAVAKPETSAATAVVVKPEALAAAVRPEASAAAADTVAAAKPEVLAVAVAAAV